MTPLALSRPIDPVTAELVRQVGIACDALGLDYLIVGATARIILLEHVLGMAPGRATRDVDLAIAVDSWASFDALCDSLVATRHFTRSSRAAQELLFHSDRMESSQSGDALPMARTPFKIDLVPFGGLESPSRTIAWPPNMAIQMSVLGFSEALASASRVQVDRTLLVRVASLPGQVVLKLIAWNDRGADTRGKDAQDFAVLAQSYFDAGNQERSYEQGLEIGTALAWDPVLLGARLLGLDASLLVSSGTRGALQALLTVSAVRERLVIDMARGQPGREDAITKATAVLAAFSSGFLNLRP